MVFPQSHSQRAEVAQFVDWMATHAA